jgi:two-component system, OmpR family, sensor histidine kinase TctE
LSALQPARAGPGLQQRLLLLLLLPLLLLAALNTWFDYRLADTSAIQQDRQLLTLVPQLADSVQAHGAWPPQMPALHMAAEIAEFLAARQGRSAYAVLNSEGRVLLGEPWLGDYPPATYEPEFSSQEYQGVVYRIVSQRVIGSAGELTVRLADGSSVRTQWLQRLWFKVVLPNLLLVVGAALGVNWAVRRALRPLLELKDAVEGRSPRDLSPLDAAGSPNEVRPLVLSLNRLFDLVNAQAESQRRFVADAAHQLRTPLAGLQAQVEAWALPESDTITLRADQIRRLRDATRRTSQLATQLLALSRADARSSQAEPSQPVELKALCEQVLEAFLDAAAARQMDLGLEAQTVQVSGYAWLLRELLVNLVDNAVRYTPVGGHVTLRCGLRGGLPGAVGGAPLQAFVEVEDDGPGVPVAERARMLERFYRLPGSPGEGNGLGLAIADEIARVHRSLLQVSSGAQGRGLRCTLLLEPVRE